jgi:hypothetical protein
MYFADVALKEMDTGYQALRGKLNGLVETYHLRQFKNARAKEFASHGSRDV